MDKIKKASPFTSDDIYNILVEEIISLTLLPGQQIGETEVAKRFGVSRTPIRDVFKRLAAHNLIEIHPQSRTQISHIDLRDISDFMFMREKLEVGILEDAIENIKEIPLLQAQISLVKQKKLLVDDSIALHQKANEFLALDNDFHHILHATTGRESIWHTFSAMLPNYQRYRTISADIHSHKDLENLCEQHNNIITALQNKDIKLLRDVYKTHIYSGSSKIGQLLEEKPTFFV